jgi:hypothetical protein
MKFKSTVKGIDELTASLKALRRKVAAQERQVKPTQGSPRARRPSAIHIKVSK